MSPRPPIIIKHAVKSTPIDTETPYTPHPAPILLKTRKHVEYKPQLPRQQMIREAVARNRSLGRFPSQGSITSCRSSTTQLSKGPSPEEWLNYGPDYVHWNYLTSLNSELTKFDHDYGTSYNRFNLPREGPIRLEDMDICDPEYHYQVTKYVEYKDPEPPVQKAPVVAPQSTHASSASSDVLSLIHI